MASAKDYERRLCQLFGTEKLTRFTLSYERDTPEEVQQSLANIRHIQKELRQIKKAINLDMKQIRAAYTQQSARVQPSRITGMLKSKGKAKSDAAKEKRKIREQRDKQLQPYDRLKLFIDDVLLQLDRGKLDLQERLTSYD